MPLTYARRLISGTEGESWQPAATGEGARVVGAVLGTSSIVAQTLVDICEKENEKTILIMR